MGIPDFKTFISHNPNTKKFERSNKAREVYEYLREPQNIDKMKIAIDNGRAALFGVLNSLENKFGSAKGDFDFNIEFVRCTVGRMVSEIICNCGYETTGNKDKNLKGKYFSTAEKYKYRLKK